MDVFHCNRVNTGKRFVEHDELRVNGETTGYLGAATLTSRQLVALVLAHLLKAKLCNEAFQFVFLIVERLSCEL